jgi:uncharacterized membrane protein YtjA (UPF0391 family)
MLNWALSFSVLSLIAILYGFNGIAAMTAAIAIILFYFVLALFVSSMLAGDSNEAKLISKNK